MVSLCSSLLHFFLFSSCPSCAPSLSDLSVAGTTCSQFSLYSLARYFTLNVCVLSLYVFVCFLASPAYLFSNHSISLLVLHTTLHTLLYVLLLLFCLHDRANNSSAEVFYACRETETIVSFFFARRLAWLANAAVCWLVWCSPD